MDLFRSSRIMSIGGNYYDLDIIDNYSRYTWTLFIVTKHDAFTSFKILARILQNENNSNISTTKLTTEGNFRMKVLKNFVINNMV